VNDRLLVALDTPDVAHAYQLMAQVAPHCGGFKVGKTLFYACAAAGSSPLELVRGGFLDLKLHDIPQQVHGAVLALLPLAPRWLSVHATGGPAMIRAAREAADTAGEARPLILAITILTSLTPGDIRRMGFQGGLAFHTLRLAKSALAAGADGVVCSVAHVAELRRKLGDAVLLTPGIRPPGAPDDDHAFTAAPREAVALGADLIVVGRPITGAEDPGEAAKMISEDLTRKEG